MFKGFRIATMVFALGNVPQRGFSYLSLFYSHLSPDFEIHRNMFFQVEQYRIYQLEMICMSRSCDFVDIRFWVLKIWWAPKTADKFLEKSPINSFQWNMSDYVLKMV